MVYKLKKESKEKQPGAARAIPWSFITETRPERGRRTVQQRKPAPRLHPRGDACERGGSDLGPHARASNAGGRIATSPRCSQKSQGLRRIHSALPGGHDDLPSPAEKTEPQTGSLIGARRLERRAPSEAATTPIRKCFSPAHTALPGSQVMKWGPESREMPFQSPGGGGSPAETGTRGVTRDARG